MTNLIAAGNMAADLASTLRGGAHSLDVVPDQVITIINGHMWQVRVVPTTGRREEFEDFAAFITTPPTRGIGSSISTLRDLCRSRPDAIDAIDRVMQRPDGNPTGANQVGGGTVYNIHGSSERPSGTSREAGLRRLRKDAPELHAAVLAGATSVHAAAVAAGHRKPAPGPLERLRKAWAAASAEERAAFMADIHRL